MSSPSHSAPFPEPAPAAARTQASGSKLDVLPQMPKFTELVPGAGPHTPGSLQNLLDVGVTVTAELGRVTLSIGEVLKLGAGSVLELDRPVSEPVDLMVQGVRLARGEVVVVDDRFAIRIKEISDPRRRS